MTFRLVIGFIILISFINSGYSQVKSHEEYYSNGQLKEEGKYFVYDPSARIIKCDKYAFWKKIGIWRYYHPSGSIHRTEKYKRIIDCNRQPVNHGSWKYWNRFNQLYRKENYKNGQLFKSTVEIYRESLLVEEIITRKGITNVNFISNEHLDASDLIRNPKFELYKYKAILIISMGTSGIEEYLPYWNTPNKSTPDYYNSFRRIAGTSLNAEYIDQNEFCFVGLILYHPTKVYSEYIQSELKRPLEKGKTYYFITTICLSQNSGYYIDRIGAYFSESPIKLPNTTRTQQYSPQISFQHELHEKNWISLCDSFTASGNEKYITIGRFFGLDEISVQENTPTRLSSIDINQSAYYYIDQVALYSDDSNFKNCCTAEDQDERLEFEEIISQQPEELINKKIILDKVYFQYNKAIILQESLKELTKLRFFMNSNSNIAITISGHTDNIGSDDFNVNLSTERAKAVYDWLVDNGIDRSRLKYTGFGEKYPIADNSSEAGRKQNRRVEFEIIK